MNYYAQGDAANADKIKAAFEKLGCDTTSWKFNIEGGFYYTHDGRIDLACGIFLINLIKTHPDYKELELTVEPCFKVGDKIEATIYGIKRRVTIREVNKTYLCYFGTLEECIGFSEQDQWHLAPKPHYDIKNFKPFDKVLCRGHNRQAWRPSLYGCYDTAGKYPMFVCATANYIQCIPFEGNEHLLGTTDMCDERFINW